jgi:hypothetical protein
VPDRTGPDRTGPERGRPGDEAIVEVAKAEPTDGTRMVAALASWELGEAVKPQGCSGSCVSTGCCNAPATPTGGAIAAMRGSFEPTRHSALSPSVMCIGTQ